MKLNDMILAFLPGIPWCLVGVWFDDCLMRNFLRPRVCNIDCRLVWFFLSVAVRLSRFGYDVRYMTTSQCSPRST
jgi:hypothetical protein